MKFDKKFEVFYKPLINKGLSSISNRTLLKNRYLYVINVGTLYINTNKAEKTKAYIIKKISPIFNKKGYYETVFIRKLFFLFSL